MKKWLLITAWILVFWWGAVESFAQCNGRYYGEIFTNVTIDADVVFGSAVADTGGSVQLLMDVYEPAGDAETNRPLLIFCHQGGFYSGTKTDADIVRFCTDFAKMGYVTASITYRLTDISNLTDSVNMIKAVFRGLQDGKAAIRYFRKDAATMNTYGIDPDAIFFGGASAGAILSTHLVYMDDSTAMPMSWQQYMTGLGGMEGHSGNPGYSTEVLGMYNFAGSLADTGWIEAGNPPLFSSHSVDDAMAMYGYGPPYGSPFLPAMYGSSLMHERAQHVGVESDFYAYPGNFHPPYKDSLVFDTSIVHLMDFLYRYVPCNSVSVNEQLSSGERFSVHPNPGSGKVRITRKGNGRAAYSLHVYNIMGLEVRAYKSLQTGMEADLMGLPGGIYLFRFTDAAGSLAGVERVALQ